MSKYVSVRDKVLEAIKDYNDTVTNPLKINTVIKMGNNELKGLLYNSFRRRFPTIFNPSKSRRFCVRLFVHDIECKFSSERTLTEMVITKKYNQDCMFDDRLDDYICLSEIKGVIKSINDTKYLAEIIEKIGHPPETSQYQRSPGIF